MPEEVEVTTNEARQATTRPRTMIWVLIGSLFLCAMAGLGPGHGVDQSSSAVPVTRTFSSFRTGSSSKGDDPFIRDRRAALAPQKWVPSDPPA